VTRAAQTVDRLLAELPPDDPERKALEARAVEYGRACGCSEGALFLAVAVVVTAVYVVVWGAVDLQTGIASLVFVFAAALVGKLAGLLLARLRLRLLGRSIARRLSHVYVH
jgi:hypothetical protein